MAVADPSGASSSSQIQDASHGTQASESGQPSQPQGDVQAVSVNVQKEEPSVSEPVKDAQSTTKDAGKPQEGGEGGQVPPTHPDQQPSISTPSATMVSIAPTSETDPAGGGSVERDRESSSASLSLNVPILRKRTRKRDDRSVSEGKYAASNTTETLPSIAEDEPKAKKKRALLFAKLTRLFTSCVSPSSRTHTVDLDEGPTRKAADQKDTEKHSAKDIETVSEKQEASSSTATGEHVPNPATTTATAAKPLVIVPPPAISDSEVVVPPTPTHQLLPLEETDGVTSGAVQPPGSTGEETKTEFVVVNETGEETDDSYAGDEAFTAALRADEDEEQRLIRQGGTGIPVGPDGKPRPLLPPVAPQHVGRKCLVLDLDETLVHSSLRPVPAPDFIVPVEIEYQWHNFYVLKRPGVDNFLKKMGEQYEIVVFTASLAKYADPVLDRLDPERTVAHRLFRESCYNHRGNYVKDLSQLGRPIQDTIILDNSPASYIFHPHNAVPVSSWFSDIHDTELGDMCPFLADLATAGDVRGILNPTV